MAFGFRRLIDDPDILRAAKLLIDQHRECAASCANRRAEDLHVRGDIGASELWRQIVEAIKELTPARQEGKQTGSAIN